MSMHVFNIFADYHQFYLWDSGVDPSAPEEYTRNDIRRLIKAVPHVVVIQPLRNATVPVELQVCSEDPGFDESQWDHVAECALDLPTGKLQVHECTGGPALNLAVPPGTYRVRALFAGLDTLSDNGLDGDDRYRIVLWPGDNIPLHIVKQWRATIAG